MVIACSPPLILRRNISAKAEKIAEDSATRTPAEVP